MVGSFEASVVPLVASEGVGVVHHSLVVDVVACWVGGHQGEGVVGDHWLVVGP